MNETDTVKTVGVIGEIFGSFLIVLEHVVALFLILKCRNVPISVKVLVTHLSLIDIIAGFWGCIRAAFRFYVVNTEVLCMLDIFVTTCVFNVSAMFVSAIAIDRYVSVFFPMKYISFVNKRTFIVVCSVIWSIGGVLATLTLICEYKYTEENGCEVRLSLTEVFPWILVSLRILCIVILVYSYSRMYKKISLLGQRYKEMRKELISIGKILVIAAPHLTLHIFYVSMFFMEPVISRAESLKYESYFTTAVIVLDTWIYVFRFKECRLNMAICLCYFNKTISQKYRKKRTLLYGTFLDEKNTNPSVGKIVKY